MGAIVRLRLCEKCEEHYEVRYLMVGDDLEPFDEFIGENCPTCYQKDKDKETK